MKIFLRVYAEKNLGDDLFLKLILERYPSVTFYLFADNSYLEIFKKHSNLKLILPNNDNNLSGLLVKIETVILRKFFANKYKKKLKKEFENKYGNIFNDCTMFVSIGGSIFMQKKTLSTYLDVEFYNYVTNSFDKVFFIGSNFGPFKDDSYKEDFKNIFRKSTDVCFRDEQSYNLFSQHKNVRFKPDVVFGMKVKKCDKIKNSIGFSIISARNNVDEEKYYRHYSQIISYYQKNGSEVFLFSFCNKEGDEYAIEKIISYLENTIGINKVFYSGNIDDFLNIYSKMESMYCGRFHSMILSMKFDQNVLPIVYSKKMVSVLKDISFNGQWIEMENFIEQSPDRMNSLLIDNKYFINHEIEESDKQFAILDHFLKHSV